MSHLPPLADAVRTLSNEELDRLRKLYPGLPRNPSQCVTCGGNGSFLWWNDGRTEPVAYDCSCVDQWMLHLFFLNSGVGKTYQRLSWEDAEGVETGARDKVADWIEHSDAYMRAGCGLILHGTKGTGKSMLSSLVLKWLLNEGYDGYFTTFAEMLSTLMGGFSDSDERVWFHSRMKNASVLVIDDLGREIRKRHVVKGEGMVDRTSPIAEAAIDDVLRHRAASSLPTILTTNLDLNELERDYGSNIISLLRERSVLYEFTGKDWRGDARMRLEREVKLGLTRPIVVG